MVTGVKVWFGPGQLSLRIDPQCDGVCGIAIFAFVVPAPHELPGRINRAAGLLHDLGHPAQTIVGKLTPSGLSGVIDRDEMVCGIPLEGPRATVARDVAIQVVTERSVRTAGLAH